MTRRVSQRTPQAIPGDRADLAGFPRLVDAFCEDMAARGYLPRTIGNRRAMLSFLAAWLAERGITRPAEVTRPVLESYQRHLFHYRQKNGQPLSFRSQSQRLLAVRAFFKWAARHRHVLHNPASEIELPRAERRLPRPALTQAEAELVLAQPDLADPLGIRDRAILEVLYSTGIRRSELANLAVTDIDHDRQTLLVRQGKGKQDRMIPIGGRALAWAGRYLAEIRPKLAVAGVDDGSLFLTAEGEPFSLDRLTQLASRYVRASGVPKQGACHLFRHTMATLMLEGGADIRYIQAMLGHARLDTTQIYAQVSVRALQAIHTATHPAAANTPRGQRDGGEAKRIAVSELLATLLSIGGLQAPSWDRYTSSIGVNWFAPQPTMQAAMPAPSQRRARPGRPACCPAIERDRVIGAAFRVVIAVIPFGGNPWMKGCRGWSRPSKWQ